VIFHVEAEGVQLIKPSSSVSNGEEEGHWFCHEIAIDKIAHGRALAVGKLWRDDGLHVASCFQDGMLRMPEPGGTEDKRLKEGYARMAFSGEKKVGKL
jgi:hypothetical protein